MTTEQLITKQQLEIEELKTQNTDFLDLIKWFVISAYAVGWPLNDNILWFNKEQRVYIKRWADSMDAFIPDYE